MFSHPILASADDEDFVRRSVMGLPFLVEKFFTLLEEMHLEGKMDRSAEVHALHYTIRSKLKILLTVPLSSYTKAVPPHEKDTELSLRLQRMGRLFIDDIVGLGPQALMWQKPLIGQAHEAAQHMTQVRIRFPLYASVIRHVVSYDSKFFPLYILVFVIVILFAVVAMIAVPLAKPSASCALIVGCITSILISLGGSASVYFFVVACKTAHLLYKWQLESGMVFGTDMDLFGLENGKFRNRHTGSDKFVCCRKDTKRGFYAIPYGEDVAYIDGRQIDEQVVMVGFDKNYLITRWNNAAEVLTGFLESGCTGKPLSEFVIAPSGDIGHDLAELRRSREKVMKVKLHAFATSPVTLFTVEAPITDVEGNVIGGVLICANTHDNLGEFRAYIRDYFTAEVKHSLSRLLESCTIPPSGTASVRCLQSFLACCFNEQVKDRAREMLTDWEWTTPDQLIAQALNNASEKHTLVIDKSFPATICIHPHVPSALRTALSTINFSCTVMLWVEHFNDAIHVFAIRFTNVVSHKGPQTKFDVKCNVGQESHTSEIRNSSVLYSVEPNMTGGGNICIKIVDDTKWEVLCEEIMQHLPGMCGNVQCDGDGVTLHFPCQVAAYFDDSDDLALGKDRRRSSIGQKLAIVNCTVNVLTLITNLVDQHNILMILMKTMFVSLTSVRDRHDLKQRLQSPSDVDVIVCDCGWLSSAQDIIFSDQNAIIIPIAEPGVSFSSEKYQYVIQTPIVGSEVRRILMDVGTAVSMKKNAITTREERERILTLRQDSPWTKGKLLGSGAFGAVYEATSDLTGGKMAVKMFYFAADKENTINKLLNEVRIMCSLNHPNIVHYFHCERMDNNVNLFMELCDVSLSDLMNGTKPKPPALSVVQVLRQILEALTYLHTRGVTHRDVKPQNILLKGNVVKLTDFGTALEGEANRDVQGTLRYMAPEVYRGEPHSTWCDIWSVGCLACELFACPCAFMDNPALLAANSSTVAYLDEVTQCAVLRDFLSKCFHDTPESRSTAADLLLHPLLRVPEAPAISQLPTIFNDDAMRRLGINLCARCERTPLRSDYSFVVDAIRDNPKSCFTDILFAWHYHAQKPASKACAIEECQLLNAKLDEFIFSHMKDRLSLYSTAHFAAEVGSVALLELLSSHGVFMCVPADQRNATHSQANGFVHVSLDDVAICHPDNQGRYLAHLAALRGHAGPIEFFIDRLGAEPIFSQRQASAHPPREHGFESLDVFETAFIYGHTPLLEWMDTVHPHYAHRAMDKRVLRIVRHAAAFGQRAALEFLLQRHGEAARAPLREAVYSAAEAGDEEMLTWLTAVVGAEVAWRVDEGGATALHHAARRGRVELLDGFFAQHDVRRHVDDRDALGRTPAMWCVMGGRKARNIEFLRRLLELGSRWPTDVDDKGRSVETLARLQLSGLTSNMLQFIMSCRKKKL